MMEFGPPNLWMMSVKNDTACSDLRLVIGRASIHFENLSITTNRSCSPGRLPQGPDDVQSSHGERPCDEYGLEGVDWEVGLACGELAPLAGTYDLVGVGDRHGPIEALAEHVAHEGTRRRVMATHACVDVPDQLTTLGDRDALLQDSRRGTLV
jgi:hypothetical protein